MTVNFIKHTYTSFLQIDLTSLRGTCNQYEVEQDEFYSNGIVVVGGTGTQIRSLGDVYLLKRGDVLRPDTPSRLLRIKYKNQ